MVQPDFVCKYRTYVLSVVLKAYYIDDEAQEHIIALATGQDHCQDFQVL